MTIDSMLLAISIMDQMDRPRGSYGYFFLTNDPHLQCRRNRFLWT